MGRSRLSPHRTLRRRRHLGRQLALRTAEHSRFADEPDGQVTATAPIRGFVRVPFCSLHLNQRDTADRCILEERLSSPVLLVA